MTMTRDRACANRKEMGRFPFSFGLINYFLLTLDMRFGHFHGGFCPIYPHKCILSCCQFGSVGLLHESASVSHLVVSDSLGPHGL